ncbi:MAG: hypothetical protein H7235_09905 [Bdellovibrionaceae bacterium]|nr:hypothetical protein [Pseudobdellovibrionaceae bacterium]
MIKNQKGQGLLETVMIIPLAILFLIYVVQFMLYLTVELAVDDAMESFVLCEVQFKPTCPTRFEQELGHLPLTKIRYQFNNQGITYKIDLEAQALKIFHIQKTRLISYDTKI